MKIKKGFLVRPIGKEFMVIQIGSKEKELNGMIHLNPAGKFLWDQLKTGITKEELIDKMMERYEDLDRATAEADLDEFLSDIAVAVEE